MGLEQRLQVEIAEYRYTISLFHRSRSSYSKTHSIHWLPAPSMTAAPTSGGAVMVADIATVGCRALGRASSDGWEPPASAADSGGGRAPEARGASCGEAHAQPAQTEATATATTAAAAASGRRRRAAGTAAGAAGIGPRGAPSGSWLPRGNPPTRGSRFPPGPCASVAQGACCWTPSSQLQNITFDFVCDHGKHRNAKCYNCLCNLFSSPSLSQNYTSNRKRTAYDNKQI